MEDRVAGLLSIPLVPSNGEPCSSQPAFGKPGAVHGYRRSYRYLAYTLTNLGLSPRDDRPGEDRPEMVAALRAAERQWLTEG